MNLLVTGGAGFIGSHVVEQALRQSLAQRVINLDALTYAGHLENLTSVAAHPNYQFERVDLRHRDEVRRVVRQHEITHVLHLAAESHVDRSIAGPEAFIHTNVVGTFNLLEACREFWGNTTDGRRFVHVSTDEVYGSLGSTGAFSENSPYAPNSPYSASKASADMLVRAYHHTYGFPAIITNGSNNFGPRQFPEKLIPVAIQCLLQRRSIPIYGDGLQVRDWIYVTDHVSALFDVLQRGRPGEVYLVGAGNEWPNRQIAERICDWVDELAPRLGGHSRKLISFVADRAGHDRRYSVDARKISHELGWKPAHTFDDALRATVRWYLENPEWLATILRSRTGATQ